MRGLSRVMKLLLPLRLLRAVFLPLWAGILLSVLVLIPGSAKAGCSCCKCVCPFICCDSGSTFSYIFQAFVDYRTDFIMDTFYTDTAEPSYMKFSDQLIKDWSSQASMIGKLMDASTTMQAMRDLQVQNAQSTRKYMPSEQVCRFGSMTTSLAVTDVKVRANQMALSEIALARHLGSIYSVAAGGRGQDNENRLGQFGEQFCDKNDNDTGLDQLCNVASPPPDRRHNRDIDFARTIDDTLTINNLDFGNATKTESEGNVIALGNYLYGHNQFVKRISPAEIGEGQGAQALLQDVRSVIAARSVAQNSYNVIAAMKAGSESGSAVKPMMDQYLSKLGISAADAKKLVGDSPSYFAQMSVLTKKIYQSPDFYAGLMDSPENVSRSTASMESFELMQDRDLFASTSRSEVLLAVLLELEARKFDESVKDRGAGNDSKP